MATFVHRDKQSALQHVLQQTYCLQADRLSACVGTGDDEDAPLLVQFDVEWHHFLAMLGQRQLQQRMHSHGPVYDLFIFECRLQCRCLFGKQGFGTDKVDLGQELVGQ